VTAQHKTRLDVVVGGRAPILMGAIEVYVAPAAHPPFVPAAQVFEEDTTLLTSAPAVLRETAEHPVRLMTEMVFQSIYPTGRVITRTRKRWLAIIYDFEQEPICTDEWIHNAWSATFQHTKRYGVHSLASPLLGITLSSISLSALADDMIDAMDSDMLPLQRLWLVTPAAQCAAVREILLDRIA